MPTCPNGHQSVSDDWCEVCGHRMAGAGAPAGAVPPPPPPPPAYGYPGPGPGGPGAPGGFGPGGDPNATAQAELCPQCRTPREHMAPFCEECRWNFLTNTATSYTPLAPQPQQSGPPPGLNLPPGFQSPPPPPAPPAQQPDPFGYQGSRPSQVNRPAEPLGAEPTHHQAPPQRPPMQQPPAPPVQQPPVQQPPVQQPPVHQPPQPPMHQPPSAPPAFLQAPPQAAPVQAPQPPAPPRPEPRADDDWVLSPPSQPQPPQPPPHQAPPHQAPPPHQQHQAPPPFQSPAPPQGWTAVIAPDREYFMAMMHRSGPEASGLNLPAYSPAKHLPLQGTQVSIGRRRHSTGESPDIDLSVPPEDPGVSHQHAVLVRQPDGSWAVVDQNSTNGTTINGGEEPIQPYVPVQLQEGDRVHVGAWTTITVHRG
ncbi:FHA domain-containing protein [Streptomyces sp. NPDC056144]|uniref:FHA domain-containing protein n=1 Tax=unclassified Streptomyces TaxID=2593676 RepID=UPI0035D52E3C